MDLHYHGEAQLAGEAKRLVDFDLESILQMVASARATDPDIALVDPAGYERSGRVLRDHTAARLLAYSLERQVIYATDGCNSCVHRPSGPLDSLSPAELRAFAEAEQLPPVLVGRLSELVRAGHRS